MRKFSFSLLFVYFIMDSHAQHAHSMEIFERIKKLNVLGSVLYVAAHPDDENTRLINYLSKSKHLRTAYISLTRGDGGQNLIGPELDEYLGAIRSQELAEARKIDGGIQYFSRANDFGYSKNAEETFEIWNRNDILFDLIKTIREFKPDVIINRFDHRGSGKTHGHHTASAILALEAFQKANATLYERERLKNYEPHIVQSIFFNTSWFFWGSREKFEQADKSNLYALDIGEFYNAYGLSNNEISAHSRSMHKSQGFGINSSRGSMMEYFERLDKLDVKGNSQSPFEGLDFSWHRLNGGGNVKQVVDEVILSYQFQKPWLSIPLLQKAEQYIHELEDSYWKKVKLQEIQEIILSCSGWFAEAYTDKHLVAPGEKISINTECIIRNPVEAILSDVRLVNNSADTTFNLSFPINKSQFWRSDIVIPPGSNYTTPFWLLQGRMPGYYPLKNELDANVTETPRNISAIFNIQIHGKKYRITKDVIYKNDDPVKGELKQNLDIIPPVYLIPSDEVYVTNNKRNCKIKLRLHAHLADQKIRIQLGKVEGMKSIPEFQDFHFAKGNDNRDFEFTIMFDNYHQSPINIPVEINGQKTYTLKSIQYDHIKWQEVMLPASVKVVCTELKQDKKRIRYVEGAGDYIDEALTHLGHEVTKIKASELANTNKSNTDVLIFGIRALNTQQELSQCKMQLLRFMEEGGKVVFQYNTTAELITDDFAPAPLKISRDRVTNEQSAVKFLDPNHIVLHKPNTISSNDFDYWVQERGLYFPGAVDSSYSQIFHLADKNESGSNNGLLIKKVGKGYFVYCSLAFFRQLPAAIPGAYRLFENIVCF